MFKKIKSKITFKPIKKLEFRLPRMDKLSLPQIGVVFLCIALLMQFALLGRNTYISTNSDAVDWGMSFQEDGAAPIGNASKEYLLQYGAFFLGDESNKIVYLTFDAGYENGYTEKTLDILKKHNVKAAFFLVGHYINTQPELVSRMVNEGHIVANHTNTHPDMTKLNKTDFAKELAANAEAFKTATGTEMANYYRPPSGKYNEENLKMAQELGYTTVLWSSAYADWDNNKQPTVEQAFNKLMPRLHPGAIVLLHLTSATNAEILDEYLTRAKQAGYTFKTLDDLREWIRNDTSF
ncbi:MAG: polysaccharide deacetylase family protein [Eubacteriaceae bacterium]|nr:polysaccharide deacetylase family protein [Eubacteriaceae bacterium]